MGVPNFQTMMLPFFESLFDGVPKHWRESGGFITKKLNVSETDQKEMVPSGLQTKFENRVVWARSYLKFAGLVSYPKRGYTQITERGLDVLRSKPARIDIKFLEKFPEFQELRRTRKKEAAGPTSDTEIDEDETSTPEEALHRGFEALRAALAAELLEIVRRVPPPFFEFLVLDLLLKMGYGGSRSDAGQSLGRSGDGGVDGIIKEDKLGLDVIYLQAKRWEDTVGPKTVREFAGSLDQHHARKGVLITTSSFSKDAREYVSKIDKKISLIDGMKLADLMIDYDLGVTHSNTYHIKRIDSDYFPEPK